MDLIWLAVGAFIFLAFTLEAITGFGSIVIALALGAQWVPIETLVPILVPLSVCMTSIMVWRHRASIDRNLLLRIVLPGMAAGTLAGYLIKPLLDAGLTQRLFGVLIMWFALRELWRMHHASPASSRPAWLTSGLTLLAGVTHGLFASGGPLLVYALTGRALDKARLRATLVTVWLILNGVLTAAFLLDGRLKQALPMITAYLPVIGAGLWAGEKLHHQVDERKFRVASFVLLLITGAVLAMRSSGHTAPGVTGLGGP